MNHEFKDSTIVQYGLPVLVAALVLILMKIGKKEEKHIKKANVSLRAKYLNVMAWPYCKFKLRKQFKKLDLDKLKEEAAKREGVDDFGEWNEQPFRSVIKLSNENQDYTPVGRLFIYEYFAKKLTMKLRMTNALKEPELHEYVSSNPISRPLFILGIGRGGTTYLHKLLSLDPNTRAPFTWELADPVPRIRDDYEKDKQKRIKYLEDRLGFFHSLVPHFGESHDLKASEPEECMYGMSVDSPIMFECFRYMFRHIDVYKSWNLTLSYQNYAKMLQILEYFSNSSAKKRWVLKAPAHLAFLPSLTEVFPDADIIWLHRDLEQVVPSFTKFLLPFWDIMEKGPFDTQELGFQVLSYMDVASKRADAFCNQMKDNSLYSMTHIKYSEFIPDPIQTIQQIYQKIGYEFTDEYHTILKEFIARNKVERERTGFHKQAKKPKLEDYGLSVQDVNQYLGWYKDKYC